MLKKLLARLGFRSGPCTSGQRCGRSLVSGWGTGCCSTRRLLSCGSQSMRIRLFLSGSGGVFI